MADNYETMTVNTMIPARLVRPDELAFLRSFFECETQRKPVVDGQMLGHDDELYFYIEESIYDDMTVNLSAVSHLLPPDGQRDEWQMTVAQLVSQRDEYGYNAIPDSWIVFETFQNIVKRSVEAGEPLKYIEMMGSFSCSRSRPGEFGGFAKIITADQIHHMDTNMWIHDKIKELELHEAAPQTAIAAAAAPTVS